jgi:hypothetical protein
MRNPILPVCIALLLLGGCAKKAAQTATGPAATVTLRDGTTFSGTVTRSSPSQITLTAVTGESRTYPMTQVDSVQYGPPQLSPPATAATSPMPAYNPPAPVTAPVETPAHSVPMIPAPAPAAAAVRTIPAGRQLVVRNNEAIDSKTAAPGQTYSGVISRDVHDSTGAIAIPHGSPATLVVRSVHAQGEVEGRSELALDLDAVSVAGRRYRVETSEVVEKGKDGLGANKRTGAFLGGGTALGALLGAVAGGGRGAAIGAVSGAAAGGVTQAVTRGHGVRVPAETLMTFRLEAPIRMREMR